MEVLQVVFMVGLEGEGNLPAAVIIGPNVVIPEALQEDHKTSTVFTLKKEEEFVQELLEEEVSPQTKEQVSLSTKICSGFIQEKEGGRLKNFVQKWKAITNDPWVLKAVTGFEMEFTSVPFQTKEPRELNFNEKQEKIVLEETENMLRKGAIVEIGEEERGFVSTLFLVEKKQKGWRSVINLRDLNFYVVYRHFKMEGIDLLRDVLQDLDWMVKLDLKDAYFTIPMGMKSQTFLQFRWKGQIYQFVCLPFGLSSAPWCFTKVMRAVVGFLRERGVRMIVYLDDLLIMNQDMAEIRMQLKMVIELLQSLGFIINVEKSVIVFGFCCGYSEKYVIFTREEDKEDSQRGEIVIEERYGMFERDCEGHWSFVFLPSGSVSRSFTL